MEQPKKILFVDDEPNVLEGLRRMLYSLRHEWLMVFAGGGPEALERLAADRFDVIVTDLRMPGMSGAELLAEVARLYPQVVRIVLSGMCDRETALHLAAVAHQFLSKPCSAEVIKKVVDRALSLRTMLSDPALKAFISRIKALPSLPALYNALMEAVNSEDAPVSRLGEIISKDPAMSAKVLQLVNSAFFGLRRHIVNPTEAALFLGTETLRSLALSVAVFSEFRIGASSRFVEELQRHSLRTALLAKKIAISEALTVAEVDEAFLGGLLHDVGRLVLVANNERQYAQCVERSRASAVPLSDVEAEEFGTTHARVGMYLLWLWGLPDSISEAVALHHDLGGIHQGKMDVAGVVYVATLLDHEAHSEASVDLGGLEPPGWAARMPTWKLLAVRQSAA